MKTSLQKVRQYAENAVKYADIVVVLVVLALVWRFWTIKASRLVHTVTTTINGKLLSTMQTTNPETYGIVDVWIYTNGSAEKLQRRKTNYLWRRY